MTGHSEKYIRKNMTWVNMIMYLSTANPVYEREGKEPNKAKPSAPKEILRPGSPEEFNKAFFGK